MNIDKTRQDKTRQDNYSHCSSSCQVSKVRRLGNLYGENRGTGFAGNVWDKNNLCPTFTTMQGGGSKPMIIDDVKECKVIGGLGEKKSNNGTQYFQQDRVYFGDIQPAQPAQLPEGSYKYIVAMRGRGMNNEQTLEANTSGTTNALTTVQKDNLCVEIKQATKDGSIKCNVGGCYDASFPESKTRRGRVQDHGNVTPTLTASSSEQINYVETQYRIRKLTPLECWRLMGYTDEDFHKAHDAGVSNSQLYKEAGNAIIKQVLMAIFRQMNIKGVKPWNKKTI